MSLVDDILENSRKARACPCPYCGHTIECSQEMGEMGLITYWAEDGVIEVECHSCEETFYVREWVTREYAVGKTEDEADGLDMQRYKS